MKLNNNFVYLALILLSSCAKTALLPTATTPVGSCTAGAFTGTNTAVSGSSTGHTMAVSVNTGNSLTNAYTNEPTVSVTICSIANPNTCQTINNILLDTGSYGLRIFNSLITIPVTPITNGDKTLAECAQFGDGSSEWGPVVNAYVKLGNEAKVAVPILAINSTYQTPPSVCTSAQSNPDVDPNTSGFNGILGVGLFAQDCGDGCLTDPNNGLYFTCENNNCSCGATADAYAQVKNPVSSLPLDNNGVILELPSVAAGGVASTSGTLYLGIDTQSDNTSTGHTRYPADSSGQFETEFAAFSTTHIPSFIDSGSSILFMPSIAALVDCSVSHGSGYAGVFCPTSIQNLTAVNYGTGGTPTSPSVSFSVENAFTLFNSGNAVFSTMAGLSSNGSDASFDWGLPFFFGKHVYVGIENTSSSLGAGPYWSY